MKILLGDTCLKSSSAALADKNNILAHMESMGEEPHSVMFPKLVDQVLETSSLKPEDLDGIASVYGPGSFTGLRIGLTYLKTLAYMLEKPLYLINTLDILAQADDVEKDILSIPLIDARNQEVYTSLYTKRNGVYESISSYEALHIDLLLDKVEKFLNKNPGFKILVSGDGQTKHFDSIKARFGNRVLDLDKDREFVNLEFGLRLLNEDKLVDPLIAMPFYLRESGAVRMKKQDGNRNKKSD